MKKTTLKGLLFVAILLFSFTLVSAGNLTDAKIVWDFEGFPSWNGSYPNGYAENTGAYTLGDLALTDLSQESSWSTIGNWALLSLTTTGTDYQASKIGGQDFRSAYTSGSNASVSFWLYDGGDDNITSIIFDLADYQTYGFGFVLDQDNYPVLVKGDNLSSDNWVRYNITILKDTWYHMVFNFDDNTFTIATSAIDLYVNGTNIGVYNRSTGGFDLTINTAYTILIGYLDTVRTPEQTSFPDNIKPVSDSDLTLFYLDQFMIYDYTLTPAQITSLYDSGAGLNPYDPDPPTVTTQPTNPLSLDNNDYSYINFTDYFSGASEYYTWYYNIWSGDWNYISDVQSVQVNVSDQLLLTLSYYDSDTLTVYSHSYDNAAMLKYMACNAVGCVNTSAITVTVGGSAVDTDEGVEFAYVNDQPDSVSIEVGNYERYVFQDHYTNLDTSPEFRVYMYNVDTGNEWTVLTVGGNHNFDSCLNYTASLQSVFFISIAEGCEYRALFVYADDYDESPLSSFVYTDPFTITTIGVGDGDTITDTEGIDPNTLSGKFLGLFPSADANNTTKLFIVTIALLIVIIASAFIAYEGSGTMGAFIGSIGVTMILIFFTIIGYIPLWLIAIMIILASTLGVTMFRRGIMGDI